jgi:MFS family permease
LLQGLALGGEYGGAATYVAEHAPQGRRGYYTAFIQTQASCGLMLALVIILVIRSITGEEAFSSYGWRIPFLLSGFLFAIALYVRLKLEESPMFKHMKESGTESKAPFSEAFGTWKNAKLAIFALFGTSSGEAVCQYTGQFYSLYFLTQTVKVSRQTVEDRATALRHVFASSQFRF